MVNFWNDDSSNSVRTDPRIDVIFGFFPSVPGSVRLNALPSSDNIGFYVDDLFIHFMRWQDARDRDGNPLGTDRASTITALQAILDGPRRPILRDADTVIPDGTVPMHDASGYVVPSGMRMGNDDRLHCPDNFSLTQGSTRLGDSASLVAIGSFLEVHNEITEQTFSVPDAIYSSEQGSTRPSYPHYEPADATAETIYPAPGSPDRIEVNGLTFNYQADFEGRIDAMLFQFRTDSTNVRMRAVDITDPADEQQAWAYPSTMAWVTGAGGVNFLAGRRDIRLDRVPFFPGRTRQYRIEMAADSGTTDIGNSSRVPFFAVSRQLSERRDLQERLHDFPRVINIIEDESQILMRGGILSYRSQGFDQMSPWVDRTSTQSVTRTLSIGGGSSTTIFGSGTDITANADNELIINIPTLRQMLLQRVIFRQGARQGVAPADVEGCNFIIRQRTGSTVREIFNMQSDTGQTFTLARSGVNTIPIDLQSQARIPLINQVDTTSTVNIDLVVALPEGATATLSAPAAQPGIADLNFNPVLVSSLLEARDPLRIANNDPNALATIPTAATRNRFANRLMLFSGAGDHEFDLEDGVFEAGTALPFRNIGSGTLTLNLPANRTFPDTGERTQVINPNESITYSLSSNLWYRVAQAIPASTANIATWAQTGNDDVIPSAKFGSPMVIDAGIRTRSGDTIIQARGGLLGSNARGYDSFAPFTDSLGNGRGVTYTLRIPDNAPDVTESFNGDNSALTTVNGEVRFTVTLPKRLYRRLTITPAAGQAAVDDCNVRLIQNINSTEVTIYDRRAETGTGFTIAAAPTPTRLVDFERYHGVPVVMGEQQVTVVIEVPDGETLTLTNGDDFLGTVGANMELLQVLTATPPLRISNLDQNNRVTTTPTHDNHHDYSGRTIVFSGIGDQTFHIDGDVFEDGESFTLKNIGTGTVTIELDGGSLSFDDITETTRTLAENEAITLLFDGLTVYVTGQITTQAASTAIEGMVSENAIPVGDADGNLMDSAITVAFENEDALYRRPRIPGEPAADTRIIREFGNATQNAWGPNRRIFHDFRLTTAMIVSHFGLFGAFAAGYDNFRAIITDPDGNGVAWFPNRTAFENNSGLSGPIPGANQFTNEVSFLSLDTSARLDAGVDYRFSMFTNHDPGRPIRAHIRTTQTNGVSDLDPPLQLRGFSPGTPVNLLTSEDLPTPASITVNEGTLPIGGEDNALVNSPIVIRETLASNGSPYDRPQTPGIPGRGTLALRQGNATNISWPNSATVRRTFSLTSQSIIDALSLSFTSPASGNLGLRLRLSDPNGPLAYWPDQASWDNGQGSNTLPDGSSSPANVGVATVFPFGQRITLSPNVAYTIEADHNHNTAFTLLSVRAVAGNLQPDTDLRVPNVGALVSLATLQDIPLDTGWQTTGFRFNGHFNDVFYAQYRLIGPITYLRASVRPRLGNGNVTNVAQIPLTFTQDGQTYNVLPEFDQTIQHYSPSVGIGTIDVSAAQIRHSYVASRIYEYNLSWVREDD